VDDLFQLNAIYCATVKYMHICLFMTITVYIHCIGVTQMALDRSIHC